MKPETLFITGATGYIGRRLIPHLIASRPKRRIVALVRNPQAAAGLESLGTSLIRGDVTRPRFGIPESDYADLTTSVTQIVHAAGDVNFGASLSDARAVNVFGTQQAINLARGCAGLRQFAHIGTISVHGLRPGPLLEQPSPPGQRFLNHYQLSKHEAECLVVRAMREIPAVVYRLSLVAADSTAGEIAQFNYVHHLLQHLPDSPLPAMPGDPLACVDLIPGDWATAALTHLFDNRFQPNTVRNLSAGLNGSVTLAEAVEIARSTMEKNLGRAVRFPPCVSSGEFERLILASSDLRARELAAIIGPHIHLLSQRQTFRNDCTIAELADTNLTVPPLRSYLPRVIEYGMRTAWGRHQPESLWRMVAN
jgi:nucleoside-diphosphate-sugar epimerase